MTLSSPNLVYTHLQLCSMFTLYSFFRSHVWNVTVSEIVAFLVVNSAIIDPTVYNGQTKLAVAESDFMSQPEIIECVKQKEIIINCMTLALICLKISDY